MIVVRNGGLNTSIINIVVDVLKVGVKFGVKCFKAANASSHTPLLIKQAHFTWEHYSLHGRTA